MAVSQKRLQASMDAGTTFSGIASCMPAVEAATKVVLCQHYPGQPADNAYCKQPSTLLYRLDSSHPSGWSCAATGFGVAEMLNNIPAGELPKFHEVSNPKLLLADKIPDDAQLPPGLQTTRVITDWLHALHVIAQDHFNNVWGNYPGYVPGEIDWTLTVPATWSDASKAVMRDAAHAAGLCAVRDSPCLQFRTEPESAAIAVMQEHGYTVSDGNRIMVVDTGGGTVDYSLHVVHRTPDGGYNMTEDVSCDAILAGATRVDQRFISYVKESLGISDEDFDDWKRQHPKQYHRWMSTSWEHAKCRFSGQERSIEVQLPQSLLRLGFSDDVDDEGALRISSQAARDKLFDPVVDAIIVKALDILRRAGKVDYLFLAGGFSSNPYLRTMLTRALGAYSANGVNTCANGGAAVMKGAVLAVRDPDIIAGRKAALAYGVGTSQTWKRGMPNRTFDAKLKRDMCYDIFKQYVAAGQLVQPDHSVQYSFSPLYPDQSVVDFNIYATQNNESCYTCDAGMHCVGSVRLLLPKDAKRSDTRDLQCKMTFGQVELKVTAVDVATGESVRAELVFHTK